MNINETLNRIRSKTNDIAKTHRELSAKNKRCLYSAHILSALAASYDKELIKLDYAFDSKKEWAEMRNDFAEIVDQASMDADDMASAAEDADERLMDMEDKVSEAYGNLINADDDYDGSY